MTAEICNPAIRAPTWYGTMTTPMMPMNSKPNGERRYFGFTAQVVLLISMLCVRKHSPSTRNRRTADNDQQRARFVALRPISAGNTPAGASAQDASNLLHSESNSVRAAATVAAPPSMVSTAPLMYDAPGDSRKREPSRRFPSAVPPFELAPSALPGCNRHRHRLYRMLVLSPSLPFRF